MLKKGITIISIVFMTFFVYSQSMNAQTSYYMQSFPNTSNVSGNLDTLSTDFKIVSSAQYTYWALWSWYYDFSDFISENNYFSASSVGAYAGLQYNENGKQSLMSIWKVEYKESQNSETKEVLAENVYPGNEESFDNEGDGVQKFVDYNWKTDNWYRMVIHLWKDKKTNHTFIGQWIEDLDSENWTLLTYYDMKISNISIAASENLLNQFQENFNQQTANEVKEIYIKNNYVKEYDSDTWRSLNRSKLCYWGYGTMVGDHIYDSYNDEYFRLKSGGTGNAHTFTSNDICIDPVEYSINQPNIPSFGNIQIQSLDVSNNTISWEYSQTSTPQETVKITIEDLSDGSKQNIEINRPEIRYYTLSTDLPEEYKITLNSTDIFKSSDTKSVETPSKSKINTLDSLSLIMTPEKDIDFNKDVNTYSVTVKNNVDKVTIVSTLTSNKSTYVEGYGNRTVDLDVGVNEIPVKVKSEFGTINTYTINIKRESMPFLDNLKINGVDLAGFSSDKYAYEIETYDSQINVTADYDSDFTVEGTGEKQLDLGQNIISIIVSNSLNDTSEYILTVITQEREPYLNDLKVDDKTVDNFERTNFIYRLEINKEDIEIKAVSNNKDYPISGDIGEKKLEYGENVYKINVINLFSESNQYILSINRPDDRSNDYTLKSLIISSGNLSFDSNKNTYDVYVSSEIESITIDSELNDKKASYVNGYGNREVELNDDITEVLIKVKAENEEVNTYTLNIIKTKKDQSETVDIDNTFKNKNIFYIIFSFSMVFIGTFIYWQLKYNR